MHQDHPHAAESNRAMRLSVAVGLLMLAGKLTAWLLTGSAAILSDAAESVVHVVAVGFAAFSLRLSYRPADSRYRYGYERVTFFSAGFEGAMIIVAAVYIIYEATARLIAGLSPHRLGLGTAMVAAASVANLLLGLYLVRTGKRTNSLILEANGKHVLTDSWTSFGVVGGLLLVLATGWQPFDPLLAIAVAINILWSGGKLMYRSAQGLMDFADPDTARLIAKELDTVCEECGLRYHELRFRNTGSRLIIEVHLLFPFTTPVGEAHRIATAIEERLAAALDVPAEVITHLESAEDHDEIHHSTNASR
jgi:cation diffusion facilitator family transporter